MTQQDVAVVAARLDDLGAKLDAVHRSLKEDIGELKVEVTEVKRQATKTNGRVTKTEKDIIELRARDEEREKHRSQSVIRQAVPGVITAVVVLLITWALIGLPTPH